MIVQTATMILGMAGGTSVGRGEKSLEHVVQMCRLTFHSLLNAISELVHSPSGASSLARAIYESWLRFLGTRSQPIVTSRSDMGHTVLDSEDSVSSSNAQVPDVGESRLGM